MGVQEKFKMEEVTILILIDGFLQSMEVLTMLIIDFGHNPYFNRWFSAIIKVEKLCLSCNQVTILI